MQLLTRGGEVGKVGYQGVRLKDRCVSPEREIPMLPSM